MTPHHPISHTTLFRGAISYLRASELLSTTGQKAPIDAFGLLSAHSLELGLKAYLISHGLTEKDLKEIGHDLEEAWTCAKAHRLPISSPPDWCQTISAAYKFPYLFRYARENTGIVVPNPDAIVRELAKLLGIIGIRIGLDMSGNAVR